MKRCFGSLALLFFICATAAFSEVIVGRPMDGEKVTVPAQYVATATTTTCPKGVASMGVYVDNKLTLVVNGTQLNAFIPLSPGQHNTVVEEWDRCGGASFTPVKVIVEAALTLPPNAISSGNLVASRFWEWNHDTDTPGSSDGATLYPVRSPFLDSAVREYDVSYSQKGGEIYHLDFAKDTRATHFVYDVDLYLPDSTQMQNVELDMNQVMSDGETVIFGTQCATGSGRWEFTTVSGGKTHWHPSNIPCSPKNWAPNTWHHIQIAYHRDDNGVVTYDSVNVDGTYNEFSNAQGNSALPLGWKTGDLVLNFQLDGASANGGSMRAYLRNLTIYRW